ncbi:hypothetical protein [Niallia sp. RD1]|uniref:hypothetical protein n=1 Tax=Niallia sp. RD1 TaxID=2962858 RepID=UPI000C787BDD|nr:hypothetical protein [Niallia sp. RD1]UTI42092.1 hypothetical protein NKG37_25315 [Niallia sp. RD1]
MDITQVASSQFVWAILCITLAAVVIREMRKDNVTRESSLINLYEESRVESKVREDKLMEHLERSNDAQVQTAKTLEAIQDHLGKIDDRVGSLEALAKGGK